MGFLSRIAAEAVGWPQLDPNDPALWGGPVYGSQAGPVVTPQAALQIAAVWACVRVISEDLAGLPLIVYQRTSAGRARATQHPLYDLLHDSPNPWQSAFEFRELLTRWALLLGNGYAEIRSGQRGPVDALVPLHPSRVTPQWSSDGQQIVYRVRGGDASERVLMQDEVFHLRGPGDDLLSGLSVVSFARETLGLARATESYGARFFSQNANAGGVLKHPGKLSPQAAQRIGADFDRRHTGLVNAHRTIVLEEGLDWVQTAMTSEDAQFLQTRQFEIAEVARWFRVPPHKIGELSKATFSNIEQQAQEYINDTLRSWAVRWEQAISRELILAPQTYYAEHLFDALVRGDLLSRSQAYATQINAGMLEPNEARAAENRDPLPGGDGLRMPLNIAPASGAPTPPARNATDTNGDA